MRTVGLSSGQLTAMMWLEQFLVIAVGLALGTWMGSRLGATIMPFLGQGSNGMADVSEAVAEGFSSVTRDQYLPIWRIKCFVGFRLTGAQLQECINHGIPGDLDCIAGDTFSQQVLTRKFGGRKAPSADRVDESAIHFFGPRVVEVVRAKASFNMPNRDALVEARQRRGHRRRGVAVYQCCVKIQIGQNAIQSVNNLCCQGCQTLPRLHDIKINVGCDVE